MLGVGLVLVLLAGLAAAGIRALSNRYERTVTKEQLLDADSRTDRTDLDGPLNYLLVGSDRRPGGSGPDQRSDTILIVHVPAGQREAYLVSIPRDLLVAIPAGSVARPPWVMTTNGTKSCVKVEVLRGALSTV